MPTPIAKLTNLRRERPAQGAIQGFLDRAEKDVVYTTEEISSALGLGQNLSRQMKALPSYTTVSGGRRIWGNPEAIKKVKGVAK